MNIKAAKTILVLVMACLSVMKAGAEHSVMSTSTSTRYIVDIPSLRAVDAFGLLAEQTSTEFLFPYEISETHITRAVTGRYTVMEALTLMLQNTGLSCGLSDKGAIRIFLSDGSFNNQEEIQKMKTKKNILSAVIAFFVGVQGSQYVSAQENGAEELLLEEVVVTATYRKSLEKALDLKRGTTSFMDAIVATDIASFPDQNLAEAMQRIPGVAIERSNGQGTTVNIRALGSDFTHTTLNGISASASDGGRAVNFKIFSSDIVQSIEVYKSPQASLVEGGISGTVQIRTPRAFDFDERKVVFSGDLAHNDYSEETDKNFSLLFSDLFLDDTLGVLMAYTAEDRSNRTDNFVGGGWGVVGSKFSGDPLLDTNGNTLAEDTLFLWSTKNYVNMNSEEKRGGLVALEYRPSDTFEIATDILVGSHIDDQNRYMSGVYFGGGDGIYDAVVDDNGVATSGTVIDAQNEMFTNKKVSETDFWMMDIDAKWEITDQWTASALVGYNRSEKEIDEGQYEWWENESDSTYEFASETISQYANQNMADWEFRRFQDKAYTYDDKKSNAQLDVERLVEEVSWIDEVQFGLRYAGSSTEYHSYRTRYDSLADDYAWDAGSGFGTAALDGAVDVNQLISGSDYLSGYGLGLVPSTFQAISTGSAMGQYGQDRPFPDEQLNNYYYVEENTTAAYIQTDLSFDMAGFPARVNAGVRYIETDQTSKGHGDDGSASCDIIICTNEVERSYSDTLPSVNMAVDLTDELIFRASVAKTMTRATLSDLSSRISYNSDDPGSDASGKNPYLDPTRSTQGEVSLEYYFAPESLISLGVFYKDLDSYTTESATGETIILGGDTYNFVTLENGEGATVTGYEFIYQQPFSFLPAPFDGLGMNFNYTFLDSNAGTVASNTGEEAPLKGLSDNSFNAVLYYEKGGFDTRLSYNYRDEAVRGTDSGAYFTYYDDYSQLDMSAGYVINDNVKVSLSVINLTDEYQTSFFLIGGDEYADDLWAYGRRISLGVKANF